MQVHMATLIHPEASSKDIIKFMGVDELNSNPLRSVIQDLC